MGNGTGSADGRARLSEEDAGKLQVKYQSFSGNKSVNTLVATNHLSALESAFDNLRKRVGNYESSVQNVSGLNFSSGKWVFYADFMLGKHHPYLSPDGGGLASTSTRYDGYTRRINLQAGYYF